MPRPQGPQPTNEVHIDVDFRRMVAPILSIALSLIFCVLVVMETRKMQPPVRKDGLNTALFAEEPETRARMEGMIGGVVVVVVGKGQRVR